MENTIKKEFYETISEFKKIIKINKSKIPEYYLDKDLFADTKDKLEKMSTVIVCYILNTLIFYKNLEGLLTNMILTLTQLLLKSMLDKIEEYCRLNALPRKIAFSEEEDNGEDELNKSDKEDNSKNESDKEDNSENESDKEDNSENESDELNKKMNQIKKVIVKMNQKKKIIVKMN